ncbi:PAS domain-containing sensor histidine kinase [Dongia rigui]|uniref:histidine kinase n=1 Tax=Dongia rigui TaxID=940149 RepID=A0ABU5DUQ1_9PROT|nr:PAS domain-containing protein [Dongia rigui]MDY0871031.1 PAS domain S-box protein [Dongia rigui]
MAYGTSTAAPRSTSQPARAGSALSTLWGSQSRSVARRWVACALFGLMALASIATIFVAGSPAIEGALYVLIVVLAVTGIAVVLRMGKASDATIAAQRQLVDAGFETADAIVILRNHDGHMLQANAVAERVSGFTSRELMEQTVWQSRFPADDWEAEQMVELQALRSDRPVFRESAWISKSGERRVIRWSNVALRHGTGTQPALLKIGLDITELRRHEMSLLRNETYLRLAHRLAKLCHWHWQSDNPLRPMDPGHRTGRFIYSEEAQDIFGYPADELPGYGDDFAAMIIHPDDRTDVFAKYKAFRTRASSSYSIEYRAIHRDGHILYIRENAEWILDDDENVIQIVGTFQDVTELRASERQLKRAQTDLRRSLRMSGLCHWSWQLSLDSVDGLPGIYQSSGDTADLLGLAPEDVALNDYDWHQRIVHPEDAKSSWDRYESFLRGPETSLIQDYRILSRYRGIRYVRSFCEKTIDAQGRVVEVAGALQDVTEQRQREAELIRAKNAAEIANRSKTEFLANMSHELRTPLNAVIGFSQVIRDRHFGDAPDRYSAYADDIHKSGQLLLKLISDVLDMSKLEAGKVDLFEEMVDIPTIAADCLRMLQARADEGNVRIEQNWERDLPALFADARAVAQVLLNVLTNAVKFSPPERSIYLTGRLGDGGDYVIVIRDTGIGMSAEAMQNLFSAFHQADATISRRFGGTGLGLAITKRLMELHGGSIDLSSEPGQGTRVVLRFPQARVRMRD